MTEFAIAPHPERRFRPGPSGRAGVALCLLLLTYTAGVWFWSGVNIRLWADCVSRYALLAALAAGLVYFCYRGGYWLGHFRHVHPRQAEYWLLLGAAASTATLAGYAIFKQLVLPDRDFAFDPLLATMGRLSLGGHAPWEVTHALLGSVRATWIIDRLYSLWLIPFFMFPMVTPVLARSEKQRVQMLFAWVLAVALIGTIGAWIFTSAGPCYFNDLIGPDPNFASLNARLAELNRQAHALGTELNAVDFQSVLLDRYRHRSFGPAGGISAMPSMHVAMATLFALAGYAIHRGLGALLAGYAALIWIGSIHLGWHYGVDGPVAMLMMLGVWRLSGRIAEWLSRPAEAPHSHSIVPGGLEV